MKTSETKLSWLVYRREDEWFYRVELHAEFGKEEIIASARVFDWFFVQYRIRRAKAKLMKRVTISNEESGEADDK